MNTATKTAVSLLVVLCACLTSADAQAQRGRARKIDGVRFDVHLDLGWHEAFGVGFRVDIPIVPDGFLRGGSIQDELAISPGLDVFFWSFHDRHYDDHFDQLRYHDGWSLMPVVAVQWNLYLNESWSIFPELGMASAFWSYDHCRDGGHDCHSHTYLRFYPLASFGARWHFSDRNALLFRMSWPVGFQFGITF